MEPILNLVISYKDDREDVYQLGDGLYILGSDPNCELSIQGVGVLGKHAAFVVKDGKVSVENLHQNATMRLNGVEVEGRRELDIGDALDIGEVCARLRIAGGSTPNSMTSPDGAAEVATSAQEDVRSGWRGYRKALEKISPFISPEEAQKAEQWHKKGLRALVRWVMVFLTLIGLSWFCENRRSFLCAEFITRVVEILPLIAVLSLTVFCRIQYAGRIFSVGIFLLRRGSIPPLESWLMYFDINSFRTLQHVIVLFFIGWLFDKGAGCVFANGRKQFAKRYSLLVMLSVVFWGLPAIWGLPDFMGSDKYCELYWVNIMAVLLFPLWAKRILRRTREEKQQDVSLVVELATIRSWRTWMSRVIAILAISAPLFYILAALGAEKMLAWDENDEELVVTKDVSGDKRAWFWEDRGRYFRKSDLDSELIYQVPYTVLAPQLGEILSGNPSSPDPLPDKKIKRAATVRPLHSMQLSVHEEKVEETRRDLYGKVCNEIKSFASRSSFERILSSRNIDKGNRDAVDAFLRTDEGNIAWSNCVVRADSLALSDLGEKICALMARVQNNATNRTDFVELATLLAPYRVKTVDMEKLVSHLCGGSDAHLFYLNETGSRETFQTGPNPRLYCAKLDIGIRSQTQSQASIEANNLSSIMIPSLVLLGFGCLLLWKRGGDSIVGFWMGIVFIGNVFLLFNPIKSFPDFFLGIFNIPDLNATVRYNVWHMATRSHVWSNVASLLGLLEWSGAFFAYLSIIWAQCFLFVLLCWPSISNERSDGRGFVDKLRTVYVSFMGHEPTIGSIFVGKFLIALGVFAVVGGFMGLLVNVANIDVKDINQVIGPGALSSVGYILAISAFCLIGWWLRRKRRFATEVPELGWEFMLGLLLFGTSLVLPVALSHVKDVQIVVIGFKKVPLVFGSTSLVSIVSGICAVLGGVLFLRVLLLKNFLSVLTPRGFTFMVLASITPAFAKVCESLTEEMIHGTFIQSKLGESIVCAFIAFILFAPLLKVLERLSRKLSMRNLVRVEKNVGRTLESVLDSQDDIDIRDEIFERMRELGLARYAFYARGRLGTFNLLLKNGWTGKSVDSFFMSEYLRGYLGKNHQAIDMGQLAQERRLFFQSFELYRLAAQLHAGCLQPICLGSSVRAVIVTPEDSDNPALSNNEVFFDNVNALGLATVASLGQRMRSKQ